MSEFQHGLIVGKFYPPHRGHLELIADAAGRCERVAVVVAGNQDEVIGLADRVRWVAWECARWAGVTVIGAVDEHPIDYEDAAVWDLHEGVFRAAVREIAPGVRMDAVFSGKDYGDELARRFDAAHVRHLRDSDGLSGTRLRGDLHGCWRDLIPSARIDLARRIVVVGAESTGTTTLARDLAQALRAGFVSEYGRAWSAAKLAGARQTANRAGDPDPDRYVGGRHPAALELAHARPPDQYILTSPDGVPFDQDGLRDGEELRQSMHKRFVRELESCGEPWVAVAGSREERVRAATLACDPVLRADLFVRVAR